MMSEASRAVFLSYASQDAEAVRRIAEALRAAGVEVWFDQNELVGGDAWDAKIRKQIADCALFVPVISAATQARREGYFRLEWKLAAQRTHMISDDTPFLLPLVIDGTRDGEARVPAEFKAVQWTRLVNAAASEAFCARVHGILKGESPAALPAPTPAGVESPRRQVTAASKGTPTRWVAVGVAVALVVTATVVVVWRPWSRSEVASRPRADTAGPRIVSSTEVTELIGRVWSIVDNPGRGRSDLESAEELCKRALALEPTNPLILAAWAHVDAWLIFLRMDPSPARREAGRARARRAVQLAPAGFETRLAWASFQIFDPGNVVPENAAEIERTLRTLLGERPGEPRTLLALGFLQRFAGQLAESRRTFEELTRDPKHAATGWCEIAYLHANAADYGAAEAPIDASLARQEFFWNLNLKALLALWWHGDGDAAGAVLDRVPRDALREDHGFDLAMAVHEWRRDGAAMLRLVENTPRDWISGWMQGPKAAYAATAYTLLGREQAAAVERAAALRVVERKLVDAPNSRTLMLWRGYLLAGQGQVADAARMLQLAQQLSDAQDAGALALQIALGRFEEAMATLEGWEREPVRADISFTAATLRHWWWFDPLRAEPRFKALQARVDVDPRFSPLAAKTKSAGRAGSTPTDASEPSVAVLPFRNLSDERTNEYLSEGISEELLNALGKVPGLKVAGRTSSFSFKGRNVPAAEISRQLRVSHLIDGSVQKEGTTVRISVQLINAADGFQLWSDTFRREMTSLLALQEEMAGLIAQKLSLKLGPRPAGTPASVNAEAFELYLQGRQAWNLRTAAGFERAEECFNRALALDPRFARALAGLVDVWTVRGGQEGKLSQFDQRNSPQIQKMLRFGQQALDLEPGLAEAHAAMGNVQWNAWNLSAATRELRAALVLNPNYASAHQWLGRVLLTDGHVDESLQALRRAHELEPLSHKIADNLGVALFAAQRPAEALAVVERALTLQPDSPWALAYRALCLAELGRTEEAIRATRFPWQSAPPNLRANLSYTLARAGARAESAQMIRGIPPEDHNAVVAAALLLLGERENCYRALESGSRMVLAIDTLLFWPVLDELRREPRFSRVVAELGLTEAHDRAQAWRAANPPEKAPGKK